MSLPAKDREPSGSVDLSGWGAITDDIEKPGYPVKLQTVNIPIVDRKTCNKAIEKIAAAEGEIMKDTVHETNICTGPLTGGISACGVSVFGSDDSIELDSFSLGWLKILVFWFQGDSGGPLVSKSADGKVELVGIVSWGMVPCGRNGAPSVFVRVSSFIDWIAETVAANRT